MRYVGNWVPSLLEVAIAAAAVFGLLIVGVGLEPVSMACMIVATTFLALSVLAAPAMLLLTNRTRTAADAFDGGLAQAILFVVWVGALFLFVLSFHRSGSTGCNGISREWVERAACAWLFGDPVRPWAAALVALPKILTFVAALVVTRLSERRLGVVLPGSPSTSLASNAQSVWDYEARRARASIRRATQHAGLLGNFASITLMVTLLVATRGPAYAFMKYGAMAVGIAVGLTYLLELTLALVRTANDDASTRMFARAGRSVVSALVTSVVASAFLSSTLQTGTGALLVGGSCALLGASALRAMTDRAGNLLGVKNPHPQNVIELFALQGLDTDDAARLSEEGVDSVHALAFCPTARLFFNTRYSLQRICDWQDQALLLAYVGPSMVAKLREQYLIRGALDAQTLAAALMNVTATDPASDPRASRVAAAMAVIRSKPGWEEDVAKMLGFSDVEHARLALNTLLNDELIDRLRLYWRAATQVSGDDGDE
jgi:hypothetical protein